MRAWGMTDIGLLRHENQDTFAVAHGPVAGQLIAVVCDGMGGAQAGQVASSIAVRTFVAELRTLLTEDMSVEQLRELCSYCVAKANTAVHSSAKENPELHGMGTTLVSAVNFGNTLVICNVGDSRAYKVGEKGIERVTRDHSVVEGLIESGNITEEQARTHPNRNLITRALGPEASIVCDVYNVELQAGEYLLLCSDGLVVTVTDEEMYEVIRSAASEADALERLLALSKEHGAPDNVTAVLLGEV
ncbi:MAG: Stp1/IreP family PP2C-type Ser/Thr phosphatase [Oscillospiraceae bacterium]|nr:Stp1/IreP family PP2C-type Ser/Thr phosphatase [Oscillospiraceae bacterium]